MLCAVWRRLPADGRLGRALLALPVGGSTARGPVRFPSLTTRGLFGEHGAGMGNTGKADAPCALVDAESAVDGLEPRQGGLRAAGRGRLLGWFGSG